MDDEEPIELDRVLSEVDRMFSETACERVIHEYTRRLELGELGSVGDLFTPDGVWEWPEGGQRVEGRAALDEFFGSRPADPLAGHISTNFVLDVDTPTTAFTRTTFTTQRDDGYSPLATVALAFQLPAEGYPANMGYYEDAFRRIDGMWLFARRVLVMELGRPTEPVSLPAEWA
jgi:hypothetical protein